MRIKVTKETRTGDEVIARSIEVEGDGFDEGDLRRMLEEVERADMQRLCLQAALEPGPRAGSVPRRRAAEASRVVEFLRRGAPLDDEQAGELFRELVRMEHVPEGAQLVRHYFEGRPAKPAEVLVVWHPDFRRVLEDESPPRRLMLYDRLNALVVDPCP